MCGRFTLHTPEPLLRKVFGVGNSAPLGLKPRYAIAPSQQVSIIRDAEASREMVMAKWGLIPHWTKDPKTKYSTINALIETVAKSPRIVRPSSIDAASFRRMASTSGKSSTAGRCPITSA